MLFYRAALPLSRATLDYLAGVVRRHRKKIGSCWCKLSAGRQALLVLAHLDARAPKLVDRDSATTLSISS
jgi:hypothetical protein